MKRRKPVVVAIALVTAFFLSDTAAHQEKTPFKTTGDEGSLVGMIRFAGIAPQPKQIDMSADPICQTANPDTEDVIVTNGKLANVVVYIQSGTALDNYSFETPSTEVVLEHQGCRYVPHVLTTMTQQTLRILNSDETVHNTHPMPRNNNEWNQTHPPGVPILKKFMRPEQFIPMRDNQHPWEKAYVGVFSHPFFSVTAADGSYRIADLPAGHYRIVAWHEKYGEQAVDVSVGNREQRTLDFTFTAPEK